MTQTSETGSGWHSRPEVIALAFGLAGGILGSLTIFVIQYAPDPESALLSGPFLGFVTVILLVALFHRPLHGLFERGNLTLQWGDKTISIQEIEEKFDEEVEARLEALASELEDLRQRLPEGPGSVEQRASAAVSGEILSRVSRTYDIESKDLALIVYHLGASNYKWRNRKTLAKRTGLSGDEVDKLAQQAPHLIVRGQGKSGNVIFRLNDSARQQFGAMIGMGT